MYQTSAMKRNYDPNESHPTHSKASKWTNILKPIWDKDPVMLITRQAPPAHKQRPEVPPAVQATNEEDDEKFEDVTGSVIPSLAGAAVETIFLPSDQVALENRLDYLFASKRAGNTGVINEITATSDELLRRKINDDNQYKLLNLI